MNPEKIYNWDESPKSLADEQIVTVYLSKFRTKVSSFTGDPDDRDVDPESADDDTED